MRSAPALRISSARSISTVRYISSLMSDLLGELYNDSRPSEGGPTP